MSTVNQVLHLLDGHKCRVDSHKPAGGPVCNVCQAVFAAEALRDRLRGIHGALVIVADARLCPPKMRPGLEEAANAIGECIE